ncbi:MAG: hypothetical protein K2K93_10025 [Muribaculaceae bacterium]|nr:hypothetical protein [Muribaculaceae bacterium]
MITLFKIILVAILIVTMIMVLLTIRHISNPEDSGTMEDSRRLRRDLETRERVITQNSLFHQFFARPTRRQN